MKDEETGSWWQQVTGEAIYGPLRGNHLKPVVMDEITFAVWKGENPSGRVLKPDPRYQGGYEAADWEARYAKFPVVTQADAKDILKPRDLVVGVVINSKERAYPMESLVHQHGVLDEVGGVPIFIIVADDTKSVRVFERKVDDKVLELFVKEGTSGIVDSQTGSLWNFTGKCREGELAGRQLKQVPLLKDYWFDWKTYHPGTSIYTLGMPGK